MYDVISHVLMTSCDSIQVYMIQLTPFYDPAEFYIKQDIFELLSTIPRSREFFNSSLQGHNTKWCNPGRGWSLVSIVSSVYEYNSVVAVLKVLSVISAVIIWALEGLFTISLLLLSLWSLVSLAYEY